MALIASVDYAAKRVYLSAATVNTSLDTLDVYREVRALRRTTDAHRQFRPMIDAGGRIEKLPGVFTASYVRLLYGCRIVPHDAEHSLRITRDTFTDDGSAGRDCFDRSTLAAAVDIDVDFPAVEVREIATGGVDPGALAAALDAALSASHGAGDWRTATGFATAGQGLTAEQAAMLVYIHRLMGLDPAIPLVADRNTRVRQAGDLVQDISTVAGVTTVTRRP
jgi:hypothetical protein